jgi:elongation factor Ts
MSITAAMVKELREKTGLPMMECKKALTEADGNEAKAIELLQNQIGGKIEKMADREAGQGRIGCYVDRENGRAGIVELRCETAPVAKTDDFIKLTDLLSKTAAEVESASADNFTSQPVAGNASQTVADAIKDVFSRLRENIQVKHVARLTGSVGSYVHHDAQTGVIVAANADCPETVLRDICMHIAFARPQALKREDMPADEVEKQRAFAKEQVKDKPAQIVDKIVEGKVNKWFGEHVLLEQAFVKDDKKTVGQVLGEVSSDLTLTGFVCCRVGA